MRVTPRLEIDLRKIECNARNLVQRLAQKGISVTGVTKSVLGSSEICHALLKAGVIGIGDSRIENIESMCHHDVLAPFSLIRSPMLSQIQRVVNSANVSFNTDINIIEQLSHFSLQKNIIHEVILMVELGDLREGIMPKDLMGIVAKTLLLPNINLKGIGCNLACRSGVIPDESNMSELSSLAESIELFFGIQLEVVSGGNSANLSWAFHCLNTGRINNIRLGESVFLGCDPLHRKPIEGLYSNAITLIAEVIESKTKPSQPWGKTAQAAFDCQTSALCDKSSPSDNSISQAILAIGIQDTDVAGLRPPSRVNIIGASSDHIILEADLQLGDEVRFGVNYSAMLRSMTSPFVSKQYLRTSNPMNP